MGVWERAGEAQPAAAAMTTAAPRRATEAIVAALEAFPIDLGRALDGHPRESLLRPARDGGWGVVEILPHLRDWEEIFLARVRQVLNEERPFLPTFDDELWAIERDYRGQDPHAVADHLRAQRAEMVDLLRDLPPEAWNRVAEHGAYGPVTLAWMTDRIADHDQEHLEQIRDALA